jgi:PilZ domain
VRRPLRGVVFKEQGTTLQAEILDVSEGGALLELEERGHFEPGEKAFLEIHPTPVNLTGSSRPQIKVVGLVTRVEAEKRRLAMAFLDVGGS